MAIVFTQYHTDRPHLVPKVGTGNQEAKWKLTVTVLIILLQFSFGFTMSGYNPK